MHQLEGLQTLAYTYCCCARLFFSAMFEIFAVFCYSIKFIPALVALLGMSASTAVPCSDSLTYLNSVYIPEK